MKVFPLLIAAASILLCCKSQKKENPQEREPPSSEDSLSTLIVQFTRFEEVDPGIMLFPLSMSQQNRQKGFYKDYKDMNYDFWNIVFYNSLTGAKHLLTNEKIRFNNYSLTTSSTYTENKSTAPFIIYSGLKEDLNEDRLLNDEDPTYLFVSSRSGQDFHQISPRGYHVQSWEYISSSNKMIMIMLADTNKDKLFNEKDDVHVFEKIMDIGSSASEVFNNQFTDSLKKNYSKYWKKIRQ